MGWLRSPERCVGTVITNHHGADKEQTIVAPVSTGEDPIGAEVDRGSTEDR